MLIKILLIVAIVIQTIATLFAIRLIRTTKYNSIWILFTIGFTLLSVERVVQFLRANGQTLPYEVFVLARGIQNFVGKSSAMHDVKIRFTTNLRSERYDTDVEVILYRVVCELVNNSLKHSGCTEINLSLSKSGDTLALDYTDNGRGFNPAAVTDCGMGLSNIASRINSLNLSLIHI